MPGTCACPPTPSAQRCAHACTRDAGSASIRCQHRVFGTAAAPRMQCEEGPDGYRASAPAAALETSRASRTFSRASASAARCSNAANARGSIAGRPLNVPFVGRHKAASRQATL
eukprot:353839-Chlamydomonas_euryale.AAC.26